MRFVWIAGVCLLGFCTPTQGQTTIDRNHASLRHVRATTAPLQALIADTAEKSPTFRAMLDRLEASTVIVYVRLATLPTLTLDGRTAFLKVDAPTPGGPRLLVVELSCSRPILAQTATLAHELRHALEIADAPWVVGTATLAQYYAQIGFRLDPSGPLRFETVAARETAAQVRRELAGGSAERQARGR
jgi:hypothetical protein